MYLGYLLRGFSLVLPILTSGVVLILAKHFRWLNFLDRPIDLGSGLFGRNKTFRGVFIYLAVTTLSVSVLHEVALFSSPFPISSLYLNEPFYLGVLWSGFYVSGELLNSLVKRWLGIAPGEHGGPLQSFIDNVDGSVFSGIPLLFIFQAGIFELLLAGLIGYGVHLLTDIWMRKLKLKK